MTNPPQYFLPKPIFEGQRNGVIECQVPGCNTGPGGGPWHYAARRELLKEAWNEHYRMNHSEEVGVVRINRQMRESLWLPLRAREG